MCLDKAAQGFHGFEEVDAYGIGGDTHSFSDDLIAEAFVALQGKRRSLLGAQLLDALTDKLQLLFSEQVLFQGDRQEAKALF